MAASQTQDDLDVTKPAVVPGGGRRPGAGNSIRFLSRRVRHRPRALDAPVTRDIPVVPVTARTESKDLLCGLSLGADGYLSKPFTVDALRGVVAEVLGGEA